MKPVIRSVTIFTQNIDEWNRGFIKHVIEDSIELLSKAVELLNKNGYNVWSKRISFSQPPPSVYDVMIDIISDYITKDVMACTGGFLVSKISEKTLIDTVSRGYYTPLLAHEVQDYVRASELIYKVSSIDPIYGTKIALSLTGNPLETPYFPLSTSINGLGIGISLLYPSLLYETFIKRGLKGVKKVLKSIEQDIVSILSELNIRIGIDFSISPWMDESVVPLITILSGSKINEPGFLHGIWMLNDILMEVSRNSPYAIGFNEVMLPYAEDNELKKAGLNGVIKARDFLLLSAVCVAGPDMILANMSKEVLKKYVLDARSIALAKNRTMGLRIIVVDEKPGTIIDLGIFGKVPVLEY